MSKPAVFLDRDGTIIRDKHYLSDPQEVELFDFTIDALRILSDLGFLLIVVSNQSGVAKGLMTEADVDKVNDKLKELLAEKDIVLDAIYYCPCHKDAIEERYRIDCSCRKPQTGMLDTAFSEFDIDRSRSFVIGDKMSDVNLGFNGNMQPILVLTGYGKSEVEQCKRDFPIVGNIYEAAVLIRQRCYEENR